MSKKVLVSFKENERDIKLFLEVMSQNNKSEFIKTCIKEYLDKREQVKEQ